MQSLFEQLIDMNRMRILSRLKSKHAVYWRRSQIKKGLASRLTDAIQLIQQYGDDYPADELALLETQVGIFKDAYGRLDGLTEKAARSVESNGDLQEMAKLAHNISSRFQLENLLKFVSSPALMNDEKRNSLCRDIRKVGRYYSASQYLITAAKRIPLFRRISVVPIKTPFKSRSGNSPKVASLVIKDACKRILKDERNQLIVKQALNRATTQVAGSLVPSPTLSLQIKNCKVHAEIQLLFFYEISTVTYKPRILCSNKGACFLCDLFIRIHGKHHIAQTHGVLYDKWILPDCSILSLSKANRKEMNQTVSRFNLALEAAIKGRLLQFPTKLKGPNESLLMFSGVWSPSVVSAASADAVSSSQRSGSKDVTQANVKQLRSAAPSNRESKVQEIGAEEPKAPVTNGDAVVLSQRQLQNDVPKGDVSVAVVEDQTSYLGANASQQENGASSTEYSTGPLGQHPTVSPQGAPRAPAISITEPVHVENRSVAMRPPRMATQLNVSDDRFHMSRGSATHMLPLDDSSIEVELGSISFFLSSESPKQDLAHDGDLRKSPHTQSQARLHWFHQNDLSSYSQASGFLSIDLGKMPEGEDVIVETDPERVAKILFQHRGEAVSLELLEKALQY